MSHITKVETQITDLDIVEEALLGLGIVVGRNATVMDYYSQSVNVPLACLRLNDGSFGIGLQLNKNGGYDILADWWLVERETALNSDDFLQKLRQRYAYLKVKKALEDENFRITEETVDEQKSIRLEVMRWR